MFDFSQPLLIAGLMMGLASSLHCLGMCSGIATSLCFAASSASASPPLRLVSVNLLLNAGRICGYVLAGAAVGGIGSGLFGALDRSIVHAVLRWGASVSLGWIGLSMIGVLPFPMLLYRIGSIVGNGAAAASRQFRLSSATGLFIAGCAWGFFPCAMVYGALFYAMLSGSWLNGAIAMLGFGLGTLFPIMATGLGFSLLRRKAQAGWLRLTVGLSILLLGVGSVLTPAAAISEWCKVG